MNSDMSGYIKIRYDFTLFIPREIIVQQVQYKVGKEQI